MPVASTADGLWGWGRPYQEPDLVIPGMQLKISPAYKGKTTWDTNIDGPLVLEANAKIYSYTITAVTSGNISFELWGAGGGAGGNDGSRVGGTGAAGSYAAGTVAVAKPNTAFTVITGIGGNVGLTNVTGDGGGPAGAPGGNDGLNSGLQGSSGGGGGGGGYSAVQQGTAYLLLAAGGGGGGGGYGTAAGSAYGQGGYMGNYGATFYNSGNIPVKQIKPDTLANEIYQRPNDGGGAGGGGGGWQQGITANTVLGNDTVGYGGGLGKSYSNVNASILTASITSIPKSAEEIFQSTITNGPLRQYYQQEYSLPPRYFSTIKFAGNINNSVGGNLQISTSNWANVSANIGNGGNGRVIVSSTYPFFDTSGYGKSVTSEFVTHHYAPGTNISSGSTDFVVKATGYDTYGNLIYENTDTSSSVKYPVRIKNFETMANVSVGNYSYGEGGLGFRFEDKFDAYNTNYDTKLLPLGFGSGLADNDPDSNLRTLFDDGDVTIEMWTKIESHTQAYGADTPMQVSFSPPNTNDRYYGSWAFGTDVNGRLKVFIRSSTTDMYTGSAIIPLLTWTHIALTWNKTTRTLTGYINGKPDLNVIMPSTFRGTSFRYTYSCLQVGRSFYAPRSDQYKNFQGWISNLRIEKRIVYTGQFNPPTAPLTSGANTVLLALQNSTSYTTTGPTLTTRGTVFVDGDGPFNYTKAHNLVADGPLSFKYPGTYTITTEKNLNLPVKVWGGQGGGSGNSSDYNGVIGGPGGFTYGIVQFAANVSYSIVVGEGGGGDNGRNLTNVYWGADEQYMSAGAGGAGSGLIFTANSSPILIAGGGGGSQYIDLSNRYNYYTKRGVQGGNGGGDQGVAGAGYYGGRGGDRTLANQFDQTWYGYNVNYIAAIGGNGGRGMYYAGFSGGRGLGNGGAGGLFWYSGGSYYYFPGGGGGGGYVGGNGSRYDTAYYYINDSTLSNIYCGGGGGGSGYVDVNNVTQIYETLTGTGNQTPNDYDPDGQGAGKGHSIYGGAPGRVIIYP